MAATWISSTQDARWQVREAAASSAAPNLCLSGTEGQTIEGFGGCFSEMGWDALGVLPDAERDSVLAALFGPGDGCRFNLARVPIGASDYALEWYSHDEVDGDSRWSTSPSTATTATCCPTSTRPWRTGRTCGSSPARGARRPG